MPIRKMAYSLAVIASLFAGESVRAQAPDPLSIPAPKAGDYTLLRGQTLQLKKPANTSSVQTIPTEAVPAPTVPNNSAITIPAYTQAPKYVPVVAVPSQLVQNKKDDPKKEDPKVQDPANTYVVKTDLPKTEELYRFESEKALEKRIKNEQMLMENFPSQPTLSDKAFLARVYNKSQMIAEPHYVCHGKLLFEDKNAERYGWDLGFIQPFVTLSYFYKDTLLFPYHAASRPFCQECSPQCQPGDQVPYILFQQGATVTGILAESGIALALAFMIP